MSEASREFMAALEGLMESFQKEQRGVLRDWKLTLVQLFVLRLVARAPAPNMSRLAEVLGVRPQTITPIVDTLERAGWIRRVPSADDRREMLLQLTPRGTRLMESVRAPFIEQLGRALDESPARSLEVATQVLRVATEAIKREAANPRHASPSRT
jgi:DNA-binding MarR family transcriptional regulator